VGSENQDLVKKHIVGNITSWMIANPEEGLAICREFFVQVPLKIVAGPPAAAKAENEMVDTTGELVIPMKMPSTEMSVRNYLSSNAARGRRIVVDFVRRTLSGGAASLLDAQFEAKLDAIAPPERRDIGGRDRTIEDAAMQARPEMNWTGVTLDKTFGPPPTELGRYGNAAYGVTRPEGDEPPAAAPTHVVDDTYPSAADYCASLGLALGPVDRGTMVPAALDRYRNATYGVSDVPYRNATYGVSDVPYRNATYGVSDVPVEPLPVVEPEETEHDRMMRFFAGK
jgi:hypothetical protein